MLVRYGLPPGWRFSRDVSRGIDLYGTFTLRSTLVRPPVLSVVYGSHDRALPFQFVDYNLNGRHYDPIEGFLDDEEVFVSVVPSLYVPPFAAPERDQEIELWRFRDADGTERVEIAVAVTPQAWPEEVLSAPYRLASKMTVYDERWRVRDTAVASWAPMERDPLGRLVGRFVLEGGADSLIVGLETVDRAEAGRGAAFADLAPEPADAALGEIRFLTRVSFDAGHAPYARPGGRALPNPGRVYPRGEPIGVAFQARGLALDPEGLHRARLRISVARPTRRGWLDVLLGRGQSPPEAELAFDHVDGGADLDAMLQVDVPPLDPGEYRLRVIVEDVLGRRVLERQGRFRVLDRSTVP
jgi:hypothetical protein